MNSLSSTITIKGKARIGSSARSSCKSEQAVRARRDTSAPGPRGYPASTRRGWRKPSGKPHVRRQLDWQRPGAGAGGGDHDLRALVQPVTRVIEGVDRRPRLEMQVGGPVDPLEQVTRRTRGCRGCRARARPRARRSADTSPAKAAPGRGWRWRSVRISCGRRTVE